MFVGASAVRAEDWAHWHGPHRSGVTSESSGWEAGAWPLNDPAWSAGVGEGSSSPIIAGGRLYIMGWGGGRDAVTCLDAATGKVVWRQTYPCPQYGRHSTGDKGMYSGPSATPELDVDDGLLYTLSTDGDLNCWNAAKGGERVWGFNLYNRYKVTQRPQVTARPGSHRDYGYTSAPLVHGPWVIVEVGDDEGNLMAFDKRTGERRWTSQNRDPAGHSGGLSPMTVDGVPCLAVLTARHLLVVRLDAGREGHTVAEFPWVTDFINNIASPAVHGQDVLVTSKYNIEAIARVHVTLDGGAKQVWRANYASGVCTPVVHEGHVYFANNGLWCLDYATGRLVLDGGRFGDASSCLITGDGRIVVWANDGDLTLIESAKRSGGAYKELSSKRGVLNSMAWPHVAMADGRLYVKTRDGAIRCFALSPDARKAAVAAENKPQPAPPVVAPAQGGSIIFQWDRRHANQAIFDATGKPNAAWKLEPRGDAKLDRRGAIILSGGAFLVHGADATLLESCRATNQLTLETIFTPANITQDGPARIVSFSTDPYNRNFTLGQERDQLVFRLRTPRTGENGQNPEVALATLAADAVHHLIVTYAPGRLIAYLNGRKVYDGDAVGGDFSNWSPHHLLFGNEWQDDRAWHGRIERVVIHNRAIDEAAAMKMFGP